jgi:23S rRNA (adenine2503-C2)-methyltransferase
MSSSVRILSLLIMMWSWSRNSLVAGWSSQYRSSSRMISRQRSTTVLASTKAKDVTSSSSAPPAAAPLQMINLHTIPKEELEQILKSWGHPKYRAGQILHWVREQGIENVEDMNNIPKKLKKQLQEYATVTSLELDCELVSKDGTQKRAYRLWDGQLIESVLMPYKDGRYTACISSQAGCAQGCVFCATGQMGFSRQLTADEILEQVSRFAAELKKDDDGTKTNGRQKRLSNIVFMGMGEPLANYRNVVEAVRRIQDEIGIGARKITISTVGLVPNIRRLMVDLPQVRLAVSLHCATDDERSALLPANKRNGGLKELMTCLSDYITTTGRRITLEWALIEGENDTPETAHNLGNLIKKYDLRRDMIHINVIPLNPTGGYGGDPSSKGRVNAFCAILENSYGVTCTPRVRRGIDINAGCGQLATEVDKRGRKEDETKELSVYEEESSLSDFMPQPPPTVGVYEADDEDDEDEDDDGYDLVVEESAQRDFIVDDETVDFEADDWEDHVYEDPEEKDEASRLLNLVKGTVLTADNVVIKSNKDYKRKIP